MELKINKVYFYDFDHFIRYQDILVLVQFLLFSNNILSISTQIIKKTKGNIVLVALSRLNGQFFFFCSVTAQLFLSFSIIFYYTLGLQFFQYNKFIDCLF